MTHIIKELRVLWAPPFPATRVRRLHPHESFSKPETTMVRMSSGVGLGPSPHLTSAPCDYPGPSLLSSSQREGKRNFKGRSYRPSVVLNAGEVLREGKTRAGGGATVRPSWLVFSRTRPRRQVARLSARQPRPERARTPSTAERPAVHVWPSLCAPKSTLGPGTWPRRPSPPDSGAQGPASRGAQQRRGRTPPLRT